jgi:hypothetical protein
MKKKILTALLILGLCTAAYGAWDASKPGDNEKLKDSPAEIRANWDAIALGTDAALQITNAKCSASMGLVDTKLAQITTANKVSGTAITGLASVPSGAGALPVANGGTAATSASAARTSLGAAASGANSDITSLTGITTPLGIAYGGTGSTSQNFVGLTGDQTIAGIKTYSSFEVTPSSAPTTNYQVANKKYVDDGLAGISSGTLYTFARVTGSDFTTTSASQVDITGLSVALSANSVYEVEVNLIAYIPNQQVNFGLGYSVSGGGLEGTMIGGAGIDAQSYFMFRMATLGTGYGYFFAHSAQSIPVVIHAIVTTGSNAGNLTVQTSVGSANTMTIRINSFMKVAKIA